MIVLIASKLFNRLCARIRTVIVSCALTSRMVLATLLSCCNQIFELVKLLQSEQIGDLDQFLFNFTLIVSSDAEYMLIMVLQYFVHLLIYDWYWQRCFKLVL